MKLRWRISKWMKMTGIGLCAAVAALWFVSVWIDIEWWDVGGVHGGMSRGRVGYQQPWMGYRSGWHIGHEWIERERRPLNWESSVDFDPNWWRIVIPIWQVLVGVGGFTAVAWRLDAIAKRQALKGMCRCGYERKGLPRGAKCPECGNGITS